ncbi:hypothetical protein [Streptomyces sp. NRRL B-24085]|uniref:hypothetical protein n=1 Tax=Streptomyces sp. NRRL B-24085 TaxID=1709476 RepID=UPI0006B309CC|nr:hypothetical protein [Streptomyces sp. NRRL B-24085]
MRADETEATHRLPAITEDEDRYVTRRLPAGTPAAWRSRHRRSAGGHFHAQRDRQTTDDAEEA